MKVFSSKIMKWSEYDELHINTSVQPSAVAGGC